MITPTGRLRNDNDNYCKISQMTSRVNRLLQQLAIRRCSGIQRASRRNLIMKTVRLPFLSTRHPLVVGCLVSGKEYEGSLDFDYFFCCR